MVTSSAWHGVYFGYYLSLGSVPLVLAVEDLYEKILRRKISNTQVYDSIAWFMRFQWFSYLGMAFQLLTVTATMTFWHSIMYVGHVILPIFYILGILIVNPVSKIVWKDVQVHVCIHTCRDMHMYTPQCKRQRKRWRKVFPSGSGPPRRWHA